MLWLLGVVFSVFSIHHQPNSWVSSSSLNRLFTLDSLPPRASFSFHAKTSLRFQIVSYSMENAITGIIPVLPSFYQWIKIGKVNWAHWHLDLVQTILRNHWNWDFLIANDLNFQLLWSLRWGQSSDFFSLYWIKRWKDWFEILKFCTIDALHFQKWKLNLVLVQILK